MRDEDALPLAEVQKGRTAYDPGSVFGAIRRFQLVGPDKHCLAIEAKGKSVAKKPTQDIQPKTAMETICNKADTQRNRKWSMFLLLTLGIVSILNPVPWSNIPRRGEEIVLRKQHTCIASGNERGDMKDVVHIMEDPYFLVAISLGR